MMATLVAGFIINTIKGPLNKPESSVRKDPLYDHT